jgi:hypothetical protein
MSSDAPRDLADRAAEAIRQLNYAAPRYPVDVYDVLGSLTVLAERLPQAFGQYARFLVAELERGRIVAEEGQPFAGAPAVAVMDAAHWLEQASRAAGQMRDALSNAQQATAGLAYAGPGETPAEPCRPERGDRP